MDIRQLRYFVAIVEHGSFSRAAARLNVAQPALSLHVRNMEAALGVELLYRTPKGVLPTETGTILLRNAQVILDQIRFTEEEIRGVESDPSGEVRLGLPGTIGEVLSVPLLKAARERFPKIRITIAEAMSGFVLEWLREARADLAVLYRDVSGAEIAVVRLLVEELWFLGPPDCDEDWATRSSIPFAQAIGQPLIVPGPTHGLRELLASYAVRANAPLNVTINIDSYSNIKELVRAGLGYSILPYHSVAFEAGESRLQSWPIVDPPISRSIYLAHSKARPMSKAVAAVRSLAREILCDLAQKGRWAGVRICEPEIDDSGSRACLTKRFEGEGLARTSELKSAGS